MEKRQLIILLIFLLLIKSMYGQTFSYGGLSYKVLEDGMSVQVGVDDGRPALSSDVASVVIPSTVKYSGKEYKVTAIGSYAFFNQPKLSSIIIPEGVVAIGDYAFQYCYKLSSIVIPESVALIGVTTFGACHSLTSIDLPKGLTKIGSSAFNGCHKLSSVVIPEGVKSIESNTFNGCSGLSSVVIPENVVSIGSKAFYGCSSLSSVVIPEGVKSIESNTFYGCFGLSSVVIPENVVSIGNRAFYGCSSLSSVVIPKNVNLIQSAAFGFCRNLTSAIIPKGVTSVADSVFRNCNKLSSVVIPESVTSIGNGAFYGCSSLSSVVIPESVTSIGNGAFYGCSSLSSVVIPKGVYSVGDGAFYACSGLSSVCISESVIFLGNNVFDCSDKSHLDVYVYSHKPISIGTSTFGMEASHSLHVPYGRVEEYASDENWKKYFNTIKEMPPRVGDYFTAKILKDDSSIKINARVVEENPFKVMLVSEDLTPIIPIDFSGGLTILGQIYGEDGLSFDVVEIGQHAFYACSDLETINIPRTVERIDKAFLSCGSLRSVTVHWINPSEIVVDTENFDGLPEDAVLYVPFGTSEQYAKIEVWNKFSQIIEFSFLYPRDIYIKPGATINLPLYLNNKEVMLGMQYRLTLPNGVLPIWENDGYMTSLTDRSKELTIISRKDPDSENGYLFAVLSLGGDSVIGNQGALLNIRVNVDKNMSPGEYKTELNDITLVTCSFDSFTPADVSSSFIVKDIMMGDVNADNYIDVADLAAQVQFILGADNINWIAYAGDMDESGEIEVNDYVALVNTILQQYYSTYMAQARNIGREEETTSLLRLSSLAIENGEEGDMCLSLVKDSVAYTALQFDLTLPAGISVVDDGTEAESRKHDVWYEKNLDGTYRVMCASMSNAEFSDGDILRLRIKADGAKQGIYEARIDNVVLSDVDAVRYTTGTARTQIQVGKNTGISELYKQGLHISIMNGNLILRAENAQRVQILLPNGLEIENLYMRDGEAKTLRLPKGIYIVNGKKINI